LIPVSFVLIRCCPVLANLPITVVDDLDENLVSALRRSSEWSHRFPFVRIANMFTQSALTLL
jgi:hypothetical protein